MDPYTATLTPTFRSRVDQIAESVQSELKETAAEQARELIRDFGTHAITRAEVGIRITREDFIDATGLSATSRSEVRVASWSEFCSSTNATKWLSDSHPTQAQKKIYEQRLRDSRTLVLGGQGNVSWANWNDDFGVFEVRGSLLSDFIKGIHFPSYPPRVVESVWVHVELAIRAYIRMGTRHMGK